MLRTESDSRRRLARLSAECLPLPAAPIGPRLLQRPQRVTNVMTRRERLTTTAAGIAVATASNVLQAAAPMQMRTLPSSGERVPVIGLGTSTGRGRSFSAPRLPWSGQRTGIHWRSRPRPTERRRWIDQREAMLRCGTASINFTRSRQRAATVTVPIAINVSSTSRPIPRMD